jgi:hypothetical protein
MPGLEPEGQLRIDENGAIIDPGDVDAADPAEE